MFSPLVVIFKKPGGGCFQFWQVYFRSRRAVNAIAEVSSFSLLATSVGVSYFFFPRVSLLFPKKIEILKNIPVSFSVRTYRDKSCDL